MATTVERPREPLTEEQVALLQPGVFIRVTKPSEDHDPSWNYVVSGRYLGVASCVDGARIRVMPEDRIERRVPLPAEVIVNVDA